MTASICFLDTDPFTRPVSSSDSSDELELLDRSLEPGRDLELELPLLLDLFLEERLVGDGVLSLTFLSGDFCFGDGDLLLAGLSSLSGDADGSLPFGGEGVLSLTILLSICLTGDGDLLLSLSEDGDHSILLASGDCSFSFCGDFSCFSCGVFSSSFFVVFSFSCGVFSSSFCVVFSFSSCVVFSFSS